MALSDHAAAETRARPRYRPQPKTWWQRIPLTVRLLPIALLAAAGYLAYRHHVATHTPIRFVAATPDGKVPPLQLTFYGIGDLLVSPSPMPPLGEQQLVDSAELTADSDLVPGRSIMRYVGPGIGAGICTVTLGTASTVKLAPPTTVRGRVMRWQPSLRLAVQPFVAVAGARVVGMGGGARGAPLAETSSDAEGWFDMDGLAADLDVLGLRLADDGHAIDNLDVPVRLPAMESPETVPPPFLITVATRIASGKVALPDDVLPRQLRIVARSLPGVDAPIAADGSFALDHIPPGVEPRLLVYGLPPRYTHQLTRARAGARGILITVLPATTISGWVLDAATRQPIPGADVFHDNGPMGLVGVSTDPDGTFTIGQVPPGILRLKAQHRGKRTGDLGPLVRSGHRDLQVEAGKPLKSIIITVQ